MKNILGKEEKLTLFNEQGKKVYEFGINSEGGSNESTYNEKGNRLTYQNSDGDSWERTYDEKGKELTYRDSKGTTRGFEIPEFTMAELVEKLGDFKLKL